MIAVTAGDLAKSPLTPYFLTHPHLLGPEGLWHTPDKHVPHKQKLPDYIENIAAALIRDGMDEQQAIPTAINAVKRWAKGDLRWGKKKITREVILASRRALKEWEDLKASHH
jgi:hypothetical protein